MDIFLRAQPTGAAPLDPQAMIRMKLGLIFLILSAGLCAEVAGPQSEFATGQACYLEGEFKQAVAHFRLALKVNPSDPDSYYWLGRSYRSLADVAFPFGEKYSSKARVNLTKAAELAPDRLDYRRELFDLLLDSAGSSRAAVRQAAGILLTVSENDPDYEAMHEQFERARKDNASAEARLGSLFLALPRAAYRIADWAASVSAARPEAFTDPELE
jgi:tetratricopeptide (TPR) repeat protein